MSPLQQQFRTAYTERPALFLGVVIAFTVIGIVIGFRVLGPWLAS